MHSLSHAASRGSLYTPPQVSVAACHEKSIYRTALPPRPSPVKFLRHFRSAPSSPSSALLSFLHFGSGFVFVQLDRLAERGGAYSGKVCNPERGPPPLCDTYPWLPRQALHPRRPWHHGQHSNEAAVPNFLSHPKKQTRASNWRRVLRRRSTRTRLQPARTRASTER